MLGQTFIGDRGRELCVVYHWVSPDAPGVIICPGIANSMSEPRYLMSISARNLYSLGINVFQFDYIGSGDSAGDYTEIHRESLIASTKQVIEFAGSLGISELGFIGYGIGNAIIASFINHPGVRAAALLSPYFRIYSPVGQKIWYDFARDFSPDPSKPVFSQRHQAFAPIGDIWRAVVGEATEGSNACGPLNPSFLQEVTGMRPREAFSTSDKPLLIISELKDDALIRQGLPVEFEPIKSDISPGRISWHWCIQCREKIIARLAGWFPLQLVTHRKQQKPPYVTVPGLPGVYRPGEMPRRYSLNIDVEGQSVLGILHVPSFISGPKPVCVIFEPGLTGNRVDIHRVGPRLAHSLTMRGFYMCRCDARGTGVSEGEFYEFTWSRRMQDLMGVMHSIEVKTGITEFVILSGSAGAKIACLAANRDQRVIGTILWGPITDEYDPVKLFPEYQKNNKSNESGEWILACGHPINLKPVRHPLGALVFDLNGIWLGLKYNIDERKYNFIREFESCRKPCLIVLTSSDKILNNSMLKIVSKHKEKQFHELPGIHGFEAELVEHVVNYSVDWLKALTAS